MSSSSLEPETDVSTDHQPEVCDRAVDSEEVCVADTREDFGALAKRLGPAGILAVMSMLFPVIGMAVLLSTMSSVGEWLQVRELAGVGLYIAGFSVFAGLALLPTWVQAVLGGWAFKVTWGSGAAIAGYVGASMIGYLIAKRASGDRVISIIEERPKWRAVYDVLLQSGFGKTLMIVTLIRVPMNSPFALTNIVLAATRTNWLAYVLGTMIGMAPRTILAVYVGSTLSNLDNIDDKPWWLVAVGIVLAVAVIAIIGSMANKAIAKVTGNNTPTDEASSTKD